MAQVKSKGGRVILLDEIRGFAIICMVVYHAMYQLKYTFNLDVPIFFENWFDVIRNIFAGTFIFISGCMCRFSRNNLKRGAQCFFLGMIVTFVVPFFGECIEFGILHMLGISMMLYGLFGEGIERIPTFVGIIFCVLLAAFTWNVSDVHAVWENGKIVVESYGFVGIKNLVEWQLPEAAYKVGSLFPFGFIDIINRGYGDYYPLLPWFFVFIGGSYFGEWAKNGDLPKFFYNSHLPWLAAVGKYTIWIYMLHLPVIYLIFSLIFH